MPPKSDKARMQSYRTRLKNDKQKYDQVKEKDRSRKTTWQASLSEAERDAERAKNKLRVQKCREKKRNSGTGKIIVQNLVPVAFRSPQALGKAKKRVQTSLPNSPRKRTAVIVALANDAGVGLKKKNPNAAGPGVNSLGPEVVEKVVDFYLSTSWMCPGQKDYVIIRKPGEEKEKVQKQYLLTTLKEAYALFKDENPGCSVSFSKFADLRPTQVQLQRDVPHNSCLCKYHENVRLLLLALNKSGLDIPTTFRDFISKIVCDQEREKCMNGDCKDCPSVQTLSPGDDVLGLTEIEWQQWSAEGGKVCKLVHQGSVEECFSELAKQVPYFLQHTYVKRVQAEAFAVEIESVKQDQNKVVIQVDFAENFTMKSQNEIQSAYWAHNQVTLFTVCAWENGGKHCLVIVSDYLQHDKYAVNFFLRVILKHLDTIRPFERVVFFSDGPSSQFKQRFMLSSISLFQRNLVWNFFATSHGKGPVDGIGGTTKRLVATEVMSGKAGVTTSKEFAAVAAEKCQNIVIKHISKSEIESEMKGLDDDWNEVTAIPNTKQVHKVSVVAPFIVDVQHHANAPSARHYFRGKPDNVDEDLPMDTNVATELGSSAETIPEDLSLKWVQASYNFNERNAKKFIGQILEMQDNKVTIKFLKKVEFGKYVWPDIDEIDSLDRSCVLKVLSEPQMDRRSRIAFSENLG